MSDGWDEWKNHVLASINEIKQEAKAHRITTEHQNRDLARELSKIRVEIASLKIKAGAWGAMAGILPAIGVLIYWVAR